MLVKEPAHRVLGLLHRALDLPAELTVADGEYSFAPAANATMQVGDFYDSNGDKLWGLAFLDGRTTFTLPAVEPSPLVAGDMTLKISAFDGEVDLQDFEIEAFVNVLNRISANTVTVSQ